MLGNLLLAILVVVLVIWLLGHFAFAVTGTLFNLLWLIILVCVIVYLFDLLSGRRRP